MGAVFLTKHTVRKPTALESNKNDNGFAMKWRNLAAEVMTPFEPRTAREILWMIKSNVSNGRNNRNRTHRYAPNDIKLGFMLKRDSRFIVHISEHGGGRAPKAKNKTKQ
jgi:hypothetical protein